MICEPCQQPHEAAECEDTQHDRPRPSCCCQHRPRSTTSAPSDGSSVAGANYEHSADAEEPG